MDKLQALAEQIEAHGEKISDLIFEVENHINVALSGSSERLIALPGNSRLVLKDDDSLELYIDNNSSQGQIKLEHNEDGITLCAGADEIINKAYPEVSNQKIIKETIGLIQRYMEEHMEDLNLQFNVSNKAYEFALKGSYDIAKDVKLVCQETAGLKALVANAANEYLAGENLSDQIRFDQYLTMYFRDEPITLSDDNQSNTYDSMQPDVIDYMDMDVNDFQNDYEKRTFVRNLCPLLYGTIILIDFDLENMGYFGTNEIPKGVHDIKNTASNHAITEDNSSAYERINNDIALTG